MNDREVPGDLVAVREGHKSRSASLKLVTKGTGVPYKKQGYIISFALQVYSNVHKRHVCDVHNDILLYVISI